jgi:O-antigen/teichoic acid export membrane protein
MSFHYWFKKNDFAFNVSKLLTGTIIGQLISVLIAPLLTRLYSSDDFGILAVYFSVASILSVAITLRLEMAVVLPESKDEALNLVILGILTSLVLSVILFVIFLPLRYKITGLIEHPELGFYLFLVPLSTFFYGSYQVLSYWFSREKVFSSLAISKIVKEIFAAITQLGMGLVFYTGALGLILGQIAGNTGGFLFLLKKTFFYIKDRFHPGVIKDLKTVFKKYKTIPLYSSWASLINAVSQNIPAILLAFLYTPAVAGFYAIATRVLTAPSMLIGNSVRQVYYQRASEMYNKGQNIFPLFNKTTLNLAAIAILPLLIILIWGNPLFSFVFGDEWGEAGVYASILSVWLFFGFLNPPAVVNMFILELNRLQLLLEIILLIFRILSILAGFWIFDDVIMSLVFFSMTGVLFQLCHIGYVYYLLKYRSNTRAKEGTMLK